MLTGIVIFMTMCAGEFSEQCTHKVMVPATTDTVENVHEWCVNFVMMQVRDLEKSPMAGKVRIKDYKCLPHEATVLLPDSIVKQLGKQQ